MASFVERLMGRGEEEEEGEEEVKTDARVRNHSHHRHGKSRKARATASKPPESPAAQTVPQLERKVVNIKDNFEYELGEKEALLKLVISGVQSLQDSLDVEKNERCDDVDELHNLCNKLRLAIDQEADARYDVDRSLDAFKEHSDYQDLELKSEIDQLREFQRETNEDKKIIMGAIMELEEKLNELRESHGAHIDDLVTNQNDIKKRIEEQILIIHRIQLSDFENATKKIQDIQRRLQDQIMTQAHDFRELTIDANKTMETQRREMTIVRRQIEDKIDELGSTVDQKENGMMLRLEKTASRFNEIEAQFGDVTSKFVTVNEQVHEAVNQIHSTRAKAEEATEIQKNRFDYFDMFMQTLKQSQATIDSRIGFLYTIVNELRWRERISDGTYKVVKRDRVESSSAGTSAPDTRSIYSTGTGIIEAENITQTINDIEMEVKAKIEIISSSLERHRKETLHALAIARDKSLASSTAVEKLKTVIETIQDKFAALQRLEKEIQDTKHKQSLTEERLNHLEMQNHNYNQKVDVIARKIWDVYDSEMNLPIFIDNYLQDDKERIWRLEYELNHLRHMTIGDVETDDTVPLHLQNMTSTTDVEDIRKGVSRCLVKSENLIEDVVAIAKQNEMLRTDMRDLRLLCDYLASKNEETQRYCRALRKHLDHTTKQLEIAQSGNKKGTFCFTAMSKSEYEDDLPPVIESKKKTPNSPKPSPTILNLFMRNKERYTTGTPVESVQAIKLKSVPDGNVEELRKPAPPKPATGGERKSISPASEISHAASGFFTGLFEGDKKEDDTEKKDTDEKKEPGLLERIFGSKKEENEKKVQTKTFTPTLPPRPSRKTDKQKEKPPQEIAPKKERINPETRITVDRGTMAEEQRQLEKESRDRLKEEREKELARREELERELIAELEEEQRRLRDENERLKAERERRVHEVTEEARRDRERSEQRKDRQSSYDKRIIEEDRQRQERMIQEAKAAREKLEQEEAERRRRADEEHNAVRELETHRPPHIQVQEKFDEVSPDTLNSQKQGLASRERLASGEQYRRQHDGLDRLREGLISAEGAFVEVAPHVALPPDTESSSEESSSSSSSVSTSEITQSATTQSHAKPASPEEKSDDPWSFDIEASRRSSRRSSDGGSSAKLRKKRSVFKKM